MTTIFVYTTQQLYFNYNILKDENNHSNQIYLLFRYAKYSTKFQ